MFAARIDQENLTYDHQRTAAAKPLNQPLGNKTPGNKAPKTPFRKQLNDENDAFNTGFKTGKKGGDGNLFTKGKKAVDVLDKSAFVTPAGPRNRAPLGMKTTNAKGAMIKTPAPKESAQKTLSPRLRRAKVKIHHEGVGKADEELAELDIEYMPPRSIPLPDYPDDDLHNEDWDMLKGANQNHGWYGIHMNPVGPDGLTRLDREMKSMMERIERQDQETIRKALANDILDFEHLAKLTGKSGKNTTKSTASSKRPDVLKRAPSSLSSKRAAAALSGSSSTSSTPHFAAPTATAAARIRAPAMAPSSAPTSRKITSSVTAPTAASSRHAVASAASRSTLGYTQGRAVSASTKQPLGTVHNRPVALRTASGNAAVAPTGAVRPASSGQNSTKHLESSPAFIKQRELLESLVADDPELEILLMEKNGSADEADNEEHDNMAQQYIEEDDELADFQLVMPDDDDE